MKKSNLRKLPKYFEEKAKKYFCWTGKGGNVITFQLYTHKITFQLDWFAF